MRRKVLILGAAGRDFHNFNVFFKDKEEYEVVGFTATQIPNIEGRIYPKELAGKLYPEGIKIYSEEELEELIEKYKIDICVFSYSDVSHEHVMHIASRCLSKGADFWLLGPKSTMFKSKKPVISVCAVRTGCGKSQTSRKVAKILKEKGKNVAVVRHPMPYGDLKKQIVQKFEKFEDLDKYNCTIEEREEFEPHLRYGFKVFAGVDYEKILEEAEKEADIILWDGGNNDFPFFKPDLHIVVTDPLRKGHEEKYHPGETNIRMADVVVINKIDSASLEDINVLRENIRKLNKKAKIVEAASPIFVSDGEKIKGKKVCVVEDGPTLTHGEMGFGAGYICALKFGAKEIVSPKEYAIGSIKQVFEEYPHLKDVLPAMGYAEKQIKELEEILKNVPCDLVISATPINLSRILKIDKEIVNVYYELQEIGSPTLSEILEEFLNKL